MSLSSSKRRPASLVAAAVALAIGASTVQADPAPDPTPELALEEVIVTGTRVEGVALSESATPVQVVTSAVLESAGRSDLVGALAQLVPSFQAQSFGGDMSNQTLQAKLRGLSPNHSLVLVDGKRRHTTANLSVGTGPYQGGAGVDLNFIPIDSIDHVEVLTDGAAALYGSDAIAGVINIITKKDPKGGSLNLKSGAFFDGDGQSLTANGNIGFAPAPGAYLNLTAEVRRKDATDRGGPDYRVFNPSTSVNPPAVAGNNPYIEDYPYINHIFGEAEANAELATLAGGYDFDDGTKLYSLFTWGHKEATSIENVRLPGQIFGTYGSQRVYPYPYGFNPRLGSDETDYSGTLGISGEIAGWKWDLSTVYGKDSLNVATTDAINSSLYAQQLANAFAAGAPIPADFQKDFNDGNLSASQWTTGLDVTRELETSVPVTLAFGAEYRKETFEIEAGEPSSYFGVGAASFPGYQPFAAALNKRDNKSIYANVIVKPVSQWTVDVAGRYEDYSDFGDTTIGKFTTRYDFNDNFAVRGTYSSGFRAPTLTEEYYSAGNVSPTSTFLQLPPNSPAAIAIIGHGLEPEKSKQFSAGLVFKTAGGFLATLDAFQIELKNRIAGSSSIYGWYLSGGKGQNGVVGAGLVSQAALDIAQGYVTIDPIAFTDPNGSIGFTLFTNGIDTKTTGIDLVLSYTSRFDIGSVDWSLSGTTVKNKVTGIAPLPSIFYSPPRNVALFDSSKTGDLEDATPDYVLNLGALARLGQFTINLREVIYGSSQTLTRTGNPVQDYVTKLGTSLITNLDVSYQATDHLSVSVGAQNLFNKYPPHINANLLSYYRSVYSNGTVSQYPSLSPYGFSGGFYYGQVSYKF